MPIHTICCHCLNKEVASAETPSLHCSSCREGNLFSIPPGKDFIVEKQSILLPGGNTLLLIRIYGPTDGKTFSLLEDLILRLNQRNYLHFIVDMSKLKMVCSTGLGSLVKIVDQLESRKGEAVFFGFPGKIPELLDMLGLSVFLKALDSEEEALEYYFPP